MYRILFFATMSLSFVTAAQASDAAFESGRTRTNLIELFTSEGCSSCPPAETWMSKLKSEPRLWRDFVPVAFHVDYWTGSAGAIPSPPSSGLRANISTPPAGKAGASIHRASFSTAANGESSESLKMERTMQGC